MGTYSIKKKKSGPRSGFFQEDLGDDDIIALGGPQSVVISKIF